MTYQASASVTATATSAASTLPPLAIVRSDASGDHRLVETDLRVLINLSARANAKLGGLAYPSVPTIATDIKVDEQHVRKSIHRLIELGYLTFIGTYPSGTKIHKVIRPGFESAEQNPIYEIYNEKTSIPCATPPGGICHPPLAESATQTKKDNRGKKQQPPTPIQLAGKPEGVVVVFPQAETAKATAINTEAVKPPPTVKESLPVALPDKHSSQSTTEHSSVVADQPVVCVPQNRIQTPTDAVPAKPSKRVAACAETKPEPTVPTTVLPVAPTTQPVATVKPISSMAKPVVAIVNGQTVQAQAQAPKQEPEHPPSFHHSLSRKEAAAILIMLAGLPIEIAAQIKAELVARLDQKSIHSSPVGYVRRLVEAARSETGFIPSATREITEREAREQAEKAKEREQAATERAKADANVAEATRLAIAMDAAGPERIAELRLEFIKNLPKFHRELFKNTGFDSHGFNALFMEHLRKTLNI